MTAQFLEPPAPLFVVLDLKLNLTKPNVRQPHAYIAETFQHIVQGGIISVRSV
jgi:hypothetical protein